MNVLLGRGGWVGVKKLNRHVLSGLVLGQDTLPFYCTC